MGTLMLRIILRFHPLSNSQSELPVPAGRNYARTEQRARLPSDACLKRLQEDGGAEQTVGGR